MQPIEIDFPKVVLEEIRTRDKSIFTDIAKAIEDAMTGQQEQGLRISDVGTCSLQLWAKVQGLLTIDEDPENIWSRLDMGTIIGAVIGVYFQAAMHKQGIPCELERVVKLSGVPGHIDILLPSYKHVYELKSNYGIKVEPPSRYHVLQAGLYTNGLQAQDGEEYTCSVVMLQPSLFKGKPRMYEYRIDEIDMAENATAELERMLRATSSFAPPLADVDANEKWRCNTCRYAGCARNNNKLR